MDHIVYLTVNLVTKSFYVGITNGNNHSQPKIYLGSGRVLKLALNKYGRENFRRFTLEVCMDRKHAAVQESYWIQKCKDKWPERRCYNLTVGGDNGEISSIETRKKIAQKLRDRAKRPDVKAQHREHGIKTLSKYVKEYGPANKVVDEKMIEYIRSKYDSYEMTATELAKELGISVSAVCKYVGIKKGCSGSGNGFAKLREPQVLEIREKAKTHTRNELAAEYNVSANAIRNIILGLTWTHI